MSNYKILVINPGSTSTKVGLFLNETPVWIRTVRHSKEDLQPYPSIIDQFPMRKQAILEMLEKEGCELQSLHGICGRGGLLHPVTGGTYRINSKMLEELTEGKFGVHASNLGAVIAHDLARSLGIPALIVDPVVVDEMDDIARVTGIPEIHRKSVFHALNQKSVLRKFAKQNNKSVEETCAIVVHLGGGISVGAHKNGRVVDVNNALNGDGPFSPERAGSLPNGQLIEFYNHLENPKDIYKSLAGNGGLTAYFKTSSLVDVEKRMQEGDARAKLVLEAMAYQIAKEIGQMSIIFKGIIDGILLTGGMAYSDWLIREIKKHVYWIAPIYVYPGEDECLALAEGTYRVLTGQESAKEYL